MIAHFKSEAYWRDLYDAALEELCQGNIIPASNHVEDPAFPRDYAELLCTGGHNPDETTFISPVLIHGFLKRLDLDPDVLERIIQAIDNDEGADAEHKSIIRNIARTQKLMMQFDPERTPDDEL